MADRIPGVRRTVSAGVIALAAVSVSAPTAPLVAQENGDPGISLTQIDVSSYGGATIAVFQSIIGNTIVDTDTRTAVSILGSGNNTHGILQFNIDGGNASNQANVHAIAIVGGANGAVLAPSIHVTRLTGGNILAVSGTDRSTSIVGSFNNSSGLFAINVNAGNLNNQVNAFAMTFGTGGNGEKAVVRVSDTTLSHVKSDPSDVEITGENKRTDSIQDSFGNFSGVLQVNVASGDGNKMSITSTVNVSVRTVK